MQNKNNVISATCGSALPNMRIDAVTSDAVKAALRMQRDLGFEPAFLSLRARGVDAELARVLLDGRKDRRKA